jgi:hypothetical protein
MTTSNSHEIIPIVLCATDAGGIRNLAPLASVCVARGLQPVIVTSQAGVGLWGEPASVGEVCMVDQASSRDLEALLKKVRPRACICGTTRFVSPDRLLVQAARAAGVRSVVVLDEWFNYRLRFEDPDTGELVYLPDAVAVQDRQAHAGAVAEGVPAHICHITGSPALAELTRRARGLAAAPPMAPEILGNGAQRPVITFLSETHAADYGTGPDSPGRLGPFIGYTEITVRQAILEALRRLGERVILVEKLHPAAADKRETGVDIPENVDFRSTRETDLWALLWHSAAVIGMRSMALLEARILGCEALSFQPGLIGPQQCTAVRLGLIPRLDQPDEVESWLASRLGRQAGRQRIIFTPDFARDGAADRVINLALQQKEGP